MRAWHVVAAFVVGAAVGHLAGARTATVAPAPAAAAAPVSVRVAPGFDASALRAEVRRAIAEECRAAASSLDPAAPAVAAAAESPESAEARDRALALVDTALAGGAWTDADVFELRPLMGRMTGAQRDEVFARLLPALNEGRLRAQIGPGPPF